jgi:glutathione S-transferase
MSRSDALTLYAETLWISPYVFSSFVALREKGLQFDVQEMVLLDYAQRQPEYRDASLTARVPALKHGDFWLSESSAIAEYLDEAFPAPQYPRLLPESLVNRARARQLMAWMRSDLGVLRDERPTTSIFMKPTHEPLSPAATADVEKLLRVSGQMVPDGGGCLFGDWSIVDAELALMLHRLIANDDAVPESIRSYAQSQWQRPSVQELIKLRRPAEVPEAYWQSDFTRAVASRK